MIFDMVVMVFLPDREKIVEGLASFSLMLFKEEGQHHLTTPKTSLVHITNVLITIANLSTFQFAAHPPQ